MTTTSRLRAPGPTSGVEPEAAALTSVALILTSRRRATLGLRVCAPQSREYGGGSRADPILRPAPRSVPAWADDDGTQHRAPGAGGGRDGHHRCGDRGDGVVAGVARRRGPGGVLRPSRWRLRTPVLLLRSARWS